MGKVITVAFSENIAASSNDDPGVTLTFFGKVKFGNLGFSMRKSENNVFFFFFRKDCS